MFLYSILVVILHVVPLTLGDGGVNRYDLGPIRADYFLHSVVFLPWMFFVFYRLEKNGRLEPGGSKTQWPGRRRFQRRKVGLGKSALWMGLGVVLAVGAEGMHYWLPYRSFNPMDALLNVLGVIAGGVIFGVGLVRKG